MKFENKYGKNEEGSVLLLSVILLMVLSVIVVMGARNSLFELTLAGNDRCSNDMRANAESAALAGLELFKALGEDPVILRRTSWADPARLSWYHNGANDCTTTPTALDGGDDGLVRAKAFSQMFLGENSTEDNWFAGSCAELRDKNGNKIASMENAKYMVIDTGPPPGKIADSLGISMDPDGSKSWHQILVTGVDEKCGGQYIVQIAYLVRF